MNRFYKKALAVLALVSCLALTGCSLKEKLSGSASGTKTISRPAVESAETQFAHPAAGDTYEGKHTEVPDVSGKSADFARQMLAAAGLNCVVEGDGNGLVQAQSEAAGSSVQRGTIVTITCG